MIEFDARDMKYDGYAFTVLGNAGENQLVIVRSWGQDGSSPLVVIEAICDGGVTVLYSSQKRLKRLDFIDTLKDVMTKWSLAGIKPTKDQERYRENQVHLVMQKISDVDGLGLHIPTT